MHDRHMPEPRGASGAEAGGAGSHGAMLVFDPGPDAALGQAVAGALGLALSPLEDRPFGHGEGKLRPLVAVAGRHVVFVHRIVGAPGTSVNDGLVRLLFLVATCRDHGARRVTVVVPCLPYARKDRRTKPHDPVTSRYVAQLFEAVGTDLLVTLDVHNLAACQNAFRIPCLNLDTHALFARDIAARHSGPLAVVSPDAGGVKRAQLLRERLEAETGRDVALAIAEKRRSAGVVSGDLFVGEVAGRTAVIVDDMIETGGTVRRAAAACKAEGAAAVAVYAAHGLFDAAQAAAVAAPPVDHLVLTDSVPPLPGAAPARLRVIPVAPLIAEALRRIDCGADTSDLLTL